MSILSYNGGGVVGMVGKNCVAIASDTRYGIRHQTVGTNFPKVFKVNNRTLVGLPGLLSDVQTIISKLKFRVNTFELEQQSLMKPSTVSGLLSSMLYERRFAPWFVEPIVVGLEGKNHKPYLCAMDLIGARAFTDSFLVGGTSSQQLYGICESLYKPNLGPDKLFEVISQSLMSAVDRDAFSGWVAL